MTRTPWQRTDDEIKAEKSAFIKIAGRTVEIKPFPQKQFESFFVEFGSLLYLYRHIIGNAKLDDADMWTRLISVKRAGRLIDAIIKKYYKIPIRVLRRRASVDEIIALLTWTYYYNADAVKKNIDCALATTKIPKMRLASGGTC